jgi:hypothetical protein
MAVLITADVKGQTQAGYDAILAAVGPALERARGFIAHGGGPHGEGWRVFEIWESEADATRFFATHIRPNLPPGIAPKRTIVALNTLMLGPLLLLVRERAPRPSRAAAARAAAPSRSHELARAGLPRRSDEVAKAGAAPC